VQYLYTLAIFRWQFSVGNLPRAQKTAIWSFFGENFSSKMTRVFLCEKSFARIEKPWKRPQDHEIFNFQAGIPTENNWKNTKIWYFMVWEAFSRFFDSHNRFLA
jgi:hypothetical protein